MIRLAFLRRRGKVLLCRLGFVAVLLVWNGWPQRQPLAWALLSLPLADAFFSLLPLLWPGVLKVRAYLYLVRGARNSPFVFFASFFRVIRDPNVLPQLQPPPPPTYTTRTCLPTGRHQRINLPVRGLDLT